MTRVSKKLTQGLLRGLLLVSKLHFDTFLGLLALENGALACTRARIPTFKSGLKAFRNNPFGGYARGRTSGYTMGSKPVPHRRAVRAFLSGPLGVARAMSTRPEKVKTCSM